MLTSSLKFETTGGEALSPAIAKSEVKLSVDLEVREWDTESCLQHTDFCCSDFCWLSTVQQPWGIGFPLRAGSAPAGNGPKMVTVKGAAHKQKDVVLNLMCRDGL